MHPRFLLRHLTIGASVFWKAVSVPVLVLITFQVLHLFSPTPADAQRLSAAILQVLGTVFLLDALLRMPETFRRPTGYRALGGWFKELWSVLRGPRKHPTAIAVGAAAGIAFASGAATVTVSRQRTLEERVSDLEKGVQEQKQELQRVAGEVREEIRTLRDSVATQRTEVEKQIQETRSLVEKVSIGEFDWGLAALFWFLVSGVISALPSWWIQL